MNFIEHPHHWTRAARQMRDPAHSNPIERDPRLSGNHWLDWVLLGCMAAGIVVLVAERFV